MSNFARPNSDVTLNGWTTHTGAATPLYAQIDESPHSETDYVKRTLNDVPMTPQRLAPVSYTTLNGVQATQYTVYGGTADDYHAMLVFVPNSHNRLVDTARIVNHFHGNSASEYQVLSNYGAGTGMNKMLNSWLELGYIVASHRIGVQGVDTFSDASNEGHYDEQWALGGNLSRAGMLDCFRWLALRFKVHANGMLMYSSSAGGTSVVNALVDCKQYGIPIAAAAMVDPVLNLRAMSGGDSSTNVSIDIKNVYALGNNVKVRSHVVGSATSSTLTDSSALNWQPDNVLAGGDVRILYGTGAGQVRTITASLDVLSQMTVSPNWDTIPNASSWYDMAYANWVNKIDVADGGHDPMVIDPSKFPNIPYALFYAATDSADGAVHSLRHSIPWADKLNALGFSVTKNPRSGGHGDNAHFDVTTTNALFTAAVP